MASPSEGRRVTFHLRRSVRGRHRRGSAAARLLPAACRPLQAAARRTCGAAIVAVAGFARVAGHCGIGQLA